MSGIAEVICIGNELLIGKTLNTNATWLAGQLTSQGLDVKRITVAGDEINEIRSVICEALKRKVQIIIVTGGLGPTFDDKTLEGIACALKRKLVVNSKALAMVKKRYEAYQKEKKIDTVKLTPPRIKMATLPEDSKPLANPVGTAPGVILKIDSSILVALPGVPPEMEAIFQDSITPIARRIAGVGGFYEKSLYVTGIAESTLAPLIDAAMREVPSVYVKSHVYSKHMKSFAEGKRCIELHLSTRSKHREDAQKDLSKAADQLTELISENDGKTEKN